MSLLLVALLPVAVAAYIVLASAVGAWLAHRHDAHDWRDDE